MKAEKIISMLGLKPHPEGGFCRETYRAGESVAREALPPRYRGPRSLSTAIYFLLTPESFSAMHRLASDEVYHFYLGDPVEMLLLEPEGRGRVVMLGNALEAGFFPQLIVPGGTWQGSKLAPGGRFALIGTTVSPGFEFEDFEMGRRDDLARLYPEFLEKITGLISL